MRTILFVFTLLFSIYLIPYNAQAQNLDSLRNALELLPDDADKLEQVNKALTAYARSKPDFALPLALANIELAKKLGNQTAEAYTTWHLGGIYRVSNQLDKSLETLKQAKQLFEITKHDNVKSIVLNELGLVYRSLLDYEKAINAHREAITVAYSVNDTARAISAMNNLGTIYYLNDQLILSRKTKKEALRLARGIKHQLLIGNLLTNLGNDYLRVSLHDSAIYYYEQAKELQEALNNQEQIGKILNNIGLVYSATGDYIKALQVQQEALRIREVIDDRRGLAFSLSNIGEVYYELNEFETSLDYHQRATEIYRELKMEYSLGLSLSNLAKCFLKMGSLETALENERAAFQILKKVTKCEELEALQGIAAVYRAMNQADSSRYYENLIYNRAVACQKPVFESQSLVFLANYDLQDGNIAAARSKSLEAYDIAARFNLPENRRGAAEKLYEIYARQNDFKKAFRYMKAYHEISDSLFNQSKARELSQVEAKYRFDQEKQQLLFAQERETLRLENENAAIDRRFNWAIGGLLVFLIVIAIVVNAYRGKARLTKQLVDSNGQLEEANGKLHQLDQFKTRLFANINHDIRTPLTLIRGYAINIQGNENNYLTEASEKDLDHLQQNTMLLSEMTNEIQDLLLLEENKLKLNFNRIEITGYVDRLVKMFSSLAELSDIKLSYEDHVEQEFIIHLDQGHFDKIFYNLISNAFRYTPAGGHIRVTLQEESDHAILQIADSGKGIAAEDLPHIFDRFYQSPLNEYRSKEGFGIGLAVVRELVNLHEGEIAVQSILTAGTTFTVKLPLNLDKAAAEPLSFNEEMSKNHPVRSANSTMISTEEKDKKTILVVDDHMEIRKYISGILAKDYQVKEASDGKQALEVLGRNHVDLIMTDLMMPWLDGYDLIEQLNAADKFAGIPVMVVSARTTEEDKHRVLDAGVNEFIAKPFDPVELEKRIQNVLQGRKQNGNHWNEVVGNQETLSVVEQNMLKKLNQVILDHVADPNLSTDLIAQQLSASRSKAIRMIKSLTGKTPLAYIKEIRMNYVDDLIKKQKVKNASEAAQSVGMKHATHFSKQYKSHFGEFPEFGK